MRLGLSDILNVNFDSLTGWLLTHTHSKGRGEMRVSVGSSPSLASASSSRAWTQDAGARRGFRAHGVRPSAGGRTVLASVVRDPVGTRERAPMMKSEARGRRRVDARAAHDLAAAMAISADDATPSR